MLEAIMLFLGLLNLWFYYKHDGLKMSLVAGVLAIIVFILMIAQ